MLGTMHLLLENITLLALCSVTKYITIAFLFYEGTLGSVFGHKYQCVCTPIDPYSLSSSNLFSLSLSMYV